jgi:predicted amidohydrolase YtcJ
MSDEKADLVLHEGVVAGDPGSDSVAIGKGRILAHGAFTEFKALVGPRTHLIRLNGRTVLPGFIDCHLHFMEGASVAAGVPVSRGRAIPDLLADLRIAAGKTPPGNWLRAFGCDESLIRERRGPTRAELDQSVPKNPLRLRHQTLHASWLNSRAIAMLGLEHPDFTAPAGGVLYRETDGRLSGLAVGMEEWIGARMPRVTAADLEARARIFSRELAAHGVTAFTDATVSNGPDDLATLAGLVASGAITQRAAAMAGPASATSGARLKREVESAGLGFAGIKFMDVARWEPRRLVRAVADALTQELDCAFHCTEVEELDAALTAIEAAPERVKSIVLAQTRCRIEHGGLIPPGYPERIASVGAWVVSNPGFLHYRGMKYAADPGLIPYVYRARSLADARISLAAGTDAPVTPAKPLTAIAAAISRVSLEGYELALEEKLPIDAAFALFAGSAAQVSRLAAGAIAPGLLADLIVLPANPYELSAAELIKLPVDLTIIGGRVVFERGRPPISASAGADPLSA